MDNFIKKIFQSHLQCPECVSPKVIQDFFDRLIGLLFPEHAVAVIKNQEVLAGKIYELKEEFQAILVKNPQLHGKSAEVLTQDFFEQLETVFDLIHLDVDAVFMGDPAAKSRMEVLRSYPGFIAIAGYRIAHLMNNLGISLIPRMISTYAHSKTGIDIHPSAHIGHHFCIDHGTGVVIGETAVIGNHVKIYQGVTLGALSVNKEDAGSKRHPTIGDHVVIYSGATILGGETEIGEHSIIGGNVWLTKSVAAHSKIYYQSQMYDAKTSSSESYLIK
jgi:serine O-acetyltransferase